MLHHRRLRLGRKPDPATRATDVADKAVCDGPPSQFFEEWLRVYRDALREFSSDPLRPDCQCGACKAYRAGSDTIQEEQADVLR